MAAVAWTRVAASAAVAAVLTAGCVTDRSDDVAAADPCGTSAAVTEALIASEGWPSAEVAGHLDQLSAATDAAGLASAADEVRAQADAEVETDRDARGAWDVALTALDAEVQGRCGFSMRVVVADATADDEPPPSEGSDLDDDDAEPGSSSWEDLVALVGDAPWVDQGYDGAVGEGPGTFVVVYGVESVQAAQTVCADVVGALLGPEAADVDPSVEIHGLSGELLAQAVGGVCVVS